MNGVCARILPVLIAGLLIGDARPEDNASGESAVAEPEFKSKAAKANFEKAQSFYGEGNYKRAAVLFKKAQRGAKSPEDKDLVGKWVKAAGGRKVLATLERRVKAKRFNRAYDEARTHARKYVGTPVEAEFKKFIRSLETKLIAVLENFDRVSNQYGKKYGKTYVRNPKPKLDGTQCLRWKNTPKRPAAALKIKQVPQDWRPFGALEFWVNVKQAPSNPQAVIACGKPRGAKRKKPPGAGSRGSHFVTRLKLKKTKGQWQRIRLPLSAFESKGGASLAAVEYFQIQVGGGTQFDLLVDRVALYRKDPARK